MAEKIDIAKIYKVTESEDFPSTILIDNTSACNLKCSMCDHENIKNYRSIQVMDRPLYNKIIDEIAVERPDARVWMIYFGDPFICKDMPDRIAYAKQKGLTDVVSNTNGVLMTPEKSREYIEAGLDAMYVGVDAFTKETYDKIRIGGDYETTVKNVLAYRDILEEIGNENQKLYVQFVISDLNEAELDDFKEFWIKERIIVKARPKLSWISLIDADNLHDNAQVDRKPCYWGVHNLCIASDGRIPYCTCDLHCQRPCGDATTHSLRELWHGELEKFRDIQMNGEWEKLPQMCQDCKDWQSYAEYIGD